ncbi:bifunctional heptose 7-phosphate kinase/heptose 1-phosphate adenyltransferase [Bailinhaonella thermotolerans]|uniref:Carbohydrate kinase PfkB domain-containing protein n=1 Tax=Bailinhaonella thermotolerans TaxID=1070861 RepID=A0A3A4BT51_9ACTN|nr:PfkB family carbohydrate kinase [Bailinhaonella thermotolerans]RJL34486.1 hypothetical protein D5H75_08710 [Bailinhaonella thermotolerans]
MTGPLVVVGDALLDIDLDGTSDRVAPDAPVPVVNCTGEHARPGGAGLAALLAAREGREVVIVTALGDDDAGQTLWRLLSRRVRVVRLPLRGRTPSKIRIRARSQTLLRLDVGEGVAGSGPVGSAVLDALRSASAVLVSDYGRGVTAHPVLRSYLARVAASAPTVWDPHPRGAPPVAGAALATPNESEAAALSPGHLRTPQEHAAHLARQWGAEAVAVTLGAKGALLSTGSGTPLTVPASPAGPAADTCGAGDSFAVAAAWALADGLPTGEATARAVQASSEYVAGGGVTTLFEGDTPQRGRRQSRPRIWDALTALDDPRKEKVTWTVPEEC